MKPLSRTNAFRSPFPIQAGGCQAIRLPMVIRPSCVLRNCLNCGQNFWARSRPIGSRRGRFCSKGCQATWHHQKRREKNLRDGPPIIKKEPEKFLHLIASIASRYTRERPINETDEYQNGFLGLWLACDTWQALQTFKKYARKLICRSIEVALVRERTRFKAMRLGECASRVILSQPNDGVCRVDARDELELVRPALKRLSKIQLRRIALRVIREESATMIAASESRPIKPENVYQSVYLSLRKLRHSMEEAKGQHDH